MNRIERFLSRQPEPHSALDHIHNPEIYSAYQVVEAMAEEYRSESLQDLALFLRERGPTFIRQLQFILQKDPKLESGFEHDDTRKLWETIGYILLQCIRLTDNSMSTAADTLLLRCSTITNETGESLVDNALLSAVGDLHSHSRPGTVIQPTTEAQAERQRSTDLRLEKLLTKFLSQYTTESEMILRGWTDVSGQTTELLHSLRRIEQAKPGAITRLAQDYGITNFNRYPETALLRQVERHDDHTSPYGLVIVARADHNGALSASRAGLEHLAEQLDGWCELRFIEISTKTELKRRLDALAERQGPANHQAEFGIILAHGNSESLVFGRNRDGDDRILTIDQLNDGLAADRDRHFTQAATLIVSACEVSKASGIAEKISKKLRINTIGPNFQTSAEDITVQVLPDGRLDFTVKYRGQRPFSKVVRKFRAAV